MTVSSDGVPNDWADQFTAEELRIVVRGGREEYKWVNIRPRNEALDCFVYALCARAQLGIAFNRGGRITIDQLLEEIEGA